MNILVIGNGFDLEHELPTKYKDFIEFIIGVNTLEKVKSRNEFINNLPESINKKVKEYLEKDIAPKENLFSECKNDIVTSELLKLSSNNIWLLYFIDIKKESGENWIDFEKEISTVIQNLDYMRKHRKSKKEHPDICCDEEKKNSEERIVSLIKYKCKKDINIEKLSNDEYYKDIIEELIKDLNNLIKCLEIYIDKYINNTKIEYVSSDIKSLEIHKVLSFNYSKTFEDIYTTENDNIECNYIHGKANYLNNTIEKANNMVLGIDEYLDDELKNTELDFIQFKKYFQRIYKRTGAEYKEWISKIVDKNEASNIYFFGHSLDITDKDILKDLILGDNEKNYPAKINIYYNDEETYARQIANLVKVIGQDKLIEKVYGVNPSIKFWKQNEKESLDTLDIIKDSCNKLNKESINEKFEYVHYNYKRNELSLGDMYSIYFKVIKGDKIEGKVFNHIGEYIQTEWDGDVYIDTDIKLLKEFCITIDKSNFSLNLYNIQNNGKREFEMSEEKNNFYDILNLIIELI